MELLFGSCLQTLGIDRPAPAVSRMPAPPEPVYFATTKQPRKMGSTILSSLLGTSGAIVAGLALFGILNAWNPLGWSILGGLTLVASAIAIGKVNKSLSWGMLGLIPGINLFATLGFAAKLSIADRAMRNRENSDAIPSARSAPVASPIILPIAPERPAPAYVLNPTSGALESPAMPAAQPAQQESRGCWACLFGGRKKQTPSAVPYTLDSEAANRNMSYF